MLGHAEAGSPRAAEASGGNQEGAWSASRGVADYLGFSRALTGLRGGHALRDEIRRQLVAWEVWQFEEPRVEARFLVSVPR